MEYLLQAKRGDGAILEQIKAKETQPTINLLTNILSRANGCDSNTARLRSMLTINHITIGHPAVVSLPELDRKLIISLTRG